MKTIRELISLSSQFLREKGIAEPRREVEELLAAALGLKRIDLYLRHDQPLEEKELEVFRGWIRRKAKREPLEYILGKTSFYGCEIALNPSVLIPRPETEILVDLIVKELQGQDLSGKELWDVCSGSGCLGIAIKKALPSLRVVLSDVSPDAARLCRENACLNGVEVEVLSGDLLEPFEGKKADFIVSNPPYISEKEYEGLDVSVAQFEPKLALVGKNGGYEFYERFASCLSFFLKEGGKAFFEIGYQQKEGVTKIFSTHFWTRFSVKQDWSRLDRFFFLEKQ